MEKIIQISGNLALTNKGKVFEKLSDGTGKVVWWEVDLPDFKDKPFLKFSKPKAKFFEPVSDKEKFEKAKNINELING